MNHIKCEICDGCHPHSHDKVETVLQTVGDGIEDSIASNSMIDYAELNKQAHNVYSLPANYHSTTRSVGDKGYRREKMNYLSKLSNSNNDSIEENDLN